MIPLLPLALCLGLSTAVPFRPRSVPAINGISSLNGTNSTGPIFASSASNWWYANIDRSNPDTTDYAPFLGTDDYQVFIAINSGDSAGLTNAIASGGPSGGERDNQFIAAEPRVIYLAPGTYELSSTLYLYTDTVIVGDALYPPTISAASGFNGDYLIVGGKDGDGNGGESKFSTVLKNLVLDTTANSGDSDFTALSWRVAQNSALVNIEINLPGGAHTGIDLGQGSTVQLGDTSINNGNTAVIAEGGMQQATLKNFAFTNNTHGVEVSSAHALNIFGASFTNVGSPIVLRNNEDSWVSVVDANVTNSGVFLNSHEDSPNFMIENISVDSDAQDVVVVNKDTKLPGATHTGTYVYGNIYGASPVYQTNPSVQDISRPSQLAPSGNYPIASANQYSDSTIDDVINLKDPSQNGGFTLKGDGSTDDGAALQGALDTAASQNKIGYLPFGVYLTGQTITIPPGTELVGNGWSTISGTGSNFTDSSNPTPVVQVGTAGQTGTAHLQDLRFTVADVLEGAIILQVNLAGDNPGDVSIHNSLITVGGTRDTNIDCSDPGQCQAAYVGMHLTESSSAYVDNVWAWVADHPSDNSSNSVGISAKGGVLVESTQATWLVGLASEHWWLYNMAYHNASNVFMSLFQSETNYDQGTGVGEDDVPPAPWTPTDSDPSFSYCKSQGCPMTAAQFFNGGSNIFSYASASWNIDGGTQVNMNVMQDVITDSHLYGLCGKSATNLMRFDNGTTFGKTDQYSGSWGTVAAEG